MLEETDIEKPLLYGIAFTAFFITGFLTATTIQTPEKKNTPPPQTTESQENRFQVSQQEAVSNAETYLRNGPLSYPFTYNISTTSIEETEVGGNNFYNWTFTYTVEANPLQGTTYQIPGNQTKTQKQMNIYISPDGTSIFPSQPIKLTG
jgi:hypothetical protein